MSFASIAKQREKDGAAHSMKPRHIKLEKPGDEILGIYVSYSVNKGDSPESTYNVYQFRTDQGLTTFNGGATLDKQISQMLTKGNLYKIVLESMGTNRKGQTMKQFDCIDYGIVDAPAE